MNRDDVDWQGYYPAFVTPFTEAGDLDLDTLRALVDHYVAEGMHGIVVNGTCGEWFSQTPEERRAVAETAVERAAGRLRVLVGSTAYTARETAQYARHALAAGADGVLASPPPYAKLFPDEVIAFYRDLDAAVDGPIAVYNWPHGSGVDIGTELADELADIDQIVAIKDSTPDADQFFATSRRVRDRVRVFGPYMSVRGLEVLRTEGGDGTVGGGSLFGRPDPAFWESYWRGEYEGPREHAVASDRLFPKLWLPGGWAGKYGAYQSQLKALMTMLGQPAGHVRRPRLPITDAGSLRTMRAVLVEEGLLAEAAEQ
ncbi:dihydrodipicolinate synthase family protein [Actinoallomurus iriomotensis]|uniref:4-hydroxy-tetrahydrodipicolinate synthase n=1 Tax=Actinoallomurus iriomotensis TaxID=478107 RepID=A0A9W6VZ70_9ACTN|nr:dihydrodipicolinate synthase family protein [Actinoallomurus iriomotensis]GLY85044.1 4-hydroxy-tetrahydrodipicolinate synthase [Actinoallomurus iriomotensis]